VGSVASRHIWILAGGPETQVNRCLPIFVALGRGLTRVGPNAALAHALKQAGNVLTVAMEKALGEIMASCEKAGMAPTDYLRFLNTETFKFPLMDAFAGAMANPSFDPADLSLDHAALSAACRVEGTPRKIAVPVAEERSAAEPPMVLEPPPAPEPNQAPETERPPEPALALPAREADNPPAEAPLATQAAVAPLPAVEADAAAPLPPDEPVPETPMDPTSSFLAVDGQRQVRLDLDHVTHFEVIKDRVWAWSQGKKYGSPWRNLREVELAFNQVLFLAIRRRVLIRPEAVLDIRPTFGGGSKARVGDGMELDVSRSATPRLKELVGI
jgi:hypothetical protein